MTNNRTIATPWPYGLAVGCKRDAERAVDGLMPMIGNGAIRNVYADPKGRFVYKIARRGGGNAVAVNASEYSRMCKIAAFDRNLSTPTALYMVGAVAVLCMLVRPSHASKATAAVADRFHSRVEVYNNSGNGDRIRDMHNDNWRLTPAGRAVVTDVGDVLW